MHYCEQEPVGLEFVHQFVQRFRYKNCFLIVLESDYARKQETELSIFA